MYDCELRVWRKMTKMRPQVVHAPPLTTTNIRCTAHLSTLPFYFHGKDGTYSEHDDTSAPTGLEPSINKN